jgi:hypothetical protein
MVVEVEVAHSSCGVTVVWTSWVCELGIRNGWLRKGSYECLRCIETRASVPKVTSLDQLHFC